MQSISVATSHNYYLYSLPNHSLHFRHSHSKPRRKPTIPSFQSDTRGGLYSLHTPHNCISNQPEQNPHPVNDSLLFHQFHSRIDSSNEEESDPQPTNRENQNSEHRIVEIEARESDGISSNMWWVDLKAALGQRINVEGIVSSVAVLVKDRHLALPHVAVPDIRYIDWGELKKRGFKGVVFDKDNTLTAPYSLTLWGPLGSSIDWCKASFGQEIAVFSNSAGLLEYDHDGSKAKALEKTIGIKVIRHRVKKPGGTSEEIEKHFGFPSSELIMVGDRPFTDVVYGNRNGFLTILTEPLSLAQEPFIVRQVRKLEVFLVNRWFKKGLKPTSHNLLPDAIHCVKDPPTV